MPRREALSTIAIALVETGALQFGRFTLSSGKASSYYIDRRRIPSFPEAYKKVVRAYRILVREVGAENLDAVAGIATSGLTFSSPLAISIRKRMAYVRHEDKSHASPTRPAGGLLL